MHTRPGGNKPAEVKSFPVKEFFSISSVVLLLLLCVLPAAAEIIDADISLAVDRQLTADENIPAHLITVSTDNGFSKSATQRCGNKE